MVMCQWPGMNPCTRPATLAVSVTWAHAPGRPHYAHLCATHLSSQANVLRPGDTITAECVA